MKVYTKYQKRSVKSRTRFGSGRGMSSREETRRAIKNNKKELKKENNKNVPRINVANKIKKMFRRKQ